MMMTILWNEECWIYNFRHKVGITYDHDQKVKLLSAVVPDNKNSGIAPEFIPNEEAKNFWKDSFTNEKVTL